MKVNHYQEVESNPVDMEGASGCCVRWLVDQHDGAPTFAMRQFDVAAGGHTPKHSHPYEHEVFVLQGNGVVVDGDTERPLKAGDFIYVAPNDIHQFRNTGDAPMKFLCMVPNSATSQTVTIVPECGIDPRE